MAKKTLVLPIAMGISGGLFLAFLAMHFGATPRWASIFGGAVSAAVAASIVIKRSQ